MVESNSENRGEAFGKFIKEGKELGQAVLLILILKIKTKKFLNFVDILRGDGLSISHSNIHKNWYNMP
ncbi:MAG: hypothetical protein RCG15_03290 [Candidatus Rickettsia vulgarisii]